jgi:pimeloyl-[acyl-carrier protein] methyl ester esterase
VTEDLKPLLVALHGWGARGAFFEDLKGRLSTLCDTIAPDLAGHGSRQYQDEVRLSDLAAQIDGIVAAQPEDRPVFLLGWSMGAAAAFTYLERYGAVRISGLIIEDMAPKPLNDESWRLGIGNGYSADDIKATLEQVRAGWARYGRRVWRATFANPDIAKRFESDPLYAAFLDNREAPMESAWKNLMELDARALIERLECPVLALMGESSHVYGPELADWYEKTLKQGEIYQLSGAGHAPHLEQPANFAGHVMHFMQKHC